MIKILQNVHGKGNFKRKATRDAEIKLKSDKSIATNRLPFEI